MQGNGCHPRKIQSLNHFKKYRLRGVLLEGYAGRVYENPNLPIIIKVIKTQSSVKNAADFLMAYRAAVHSCEYKNSADKPVIVIVSKDFGLEAIVVMLKVCNFTVLVVQYLKKFYVRKSHSMRIFVVLLRSYYNFAKSGNNKTLKQK